MALGCGVAIGYGLTMASSHTDHRPAPIVRTALWSALALAMAGAVYLYAVRGPALLLDLASGMAGILCL